MNPLIRTRSQLIRSRPSHVTREATGRVADSEPRDHAEVDAIACSDRGERLASITPAQLRCALLYVFGTPPLNQALWSAGVVSLMVVCVLGRLNTSGGRSWKARRLRRSDLFCGHANAPPSPPAADEKRYRELDGNRGRGLVLSRTGPRQNVS